MRQGRHFTKLCLAAMLSATFSLPASSLSLKEAYLAALEYDADLLAARSAQEESREGVPVARAALLPQISYSKQRNRADTNTNYLDSKYPDQDSGRYFSSSSALTLRQALFRKPAWDALQVAKAQAEAADAIYEKENQNAGLRAVSAYLEVLSARASTTLARKQTAAMEAWLAMAEKTFKAGRGTRTDIEDARSRLDISRAKETEAHIYLSTAERNFEVVTGKAADKIPEHEHRQLNPELMLVNQKEQWLQRIEDSNPDIQSLRMQLEAARSSVAQFRGGHLPTVDLVAARQNSLSDTNTSIGVEYDTSYVGIQINVPIFSGGGVSAQTRQALAREEKIRQSLESARRKTLAEANKLYQTLWQGNELVQALNQAVLSGEQAVLGEKKGVQAGTRTFVDALEAERRLYESMRDHATAIYSLANTRLKFLSLAGAIDFEAIDTLSAWLTSARH